MEIEKDEENSICSGLETDSNSLNIPSEIILTQKNDFISEINSLKYKLYHDQFTSLFNKYNIDINSIYLLITNYAISSNGQMRIDYNNFIYYAEKLITNIYNMKYFLKENKIEELIKEINIINENILNNKKILFMVRREKLLYLIKNNYVNDSLIYAREYLVPLTENNDILYKELGNVMGLLAYENIDDCPDKELLSDCNTKKIEDEIISFILKFLIKLN